VPSGFLFVKNLASSKKLVILPMLKGR